MNAFYGCRGLTEITIPEKVTSIVLEAFRECQFTDIYFNVVNCTQGNCAFRNCPGTLHIGSKVTTIPVRGFSDSQIAGSLTFPASLRTIGDFAFDACYDLTGTLPSRRGNKYWCTRIL